MEGGKEANLPELLDKILDLRKKGSEENLVTVAELIEEFRQAAGYSISAFCAKIGVVPSTYSRWKKGEPPPLHRLESFRKIVSESDESHSFADSVNLADGSRLILRPFSKLLERQKRCRRIWSIKNTLPYIEGSHGDVREKVTDLLSNRKDALEFHCVFWGPKNLDDYKESIDIRSDYPAMDSFASWRKALLRKDEEYPNLFGWRVYECEEAFELGMSSLGIGLIILEYDAESTKAHRSLSMREVDFLIESPHSVYTKHVLKTGGPKTRWAEIHPDESEWQWKQIKPLLELMIKGQGRNGRQWSKRFLKTNEEAEAYQTKKFAQV